MYYCFKSNNSFNLHNKLYNWDHFANGKKKWEKLGGMSKVTEFTSDGPRNQTQVASSKNLSLETQRSPQIKVKAAISVQVSSYKCAMLYPLDSDNHIVIFKSLDPT